MKHEFIHKLNIKNLLFLHEQIEDALKEQDANDLLDYIKKLEAQRENVRNNKHYDLITKHIALLDSVANFNCL